MAKLDALGFVWGQVPGKLWEKNFQTLEQFKLEHGHCDVSSGSERALYEWSRWQRNFRTKGLLGTEKIQRLGQLSREQIQRLDAVGYLPWDARATGAKRMNDRSQAMLEAGEADLKLRALEAAEKAAEVIDVKKGDTEIPADGETLESVVPPPEDPGAHGGGGRGR